MIGIEGDGGRERRPFCKPRRRVVPSIQEYMISWRDYECERLCRGRDERQTHQASKSTNNSYTRPASGF